MAALLLVGCSGSGKPTAAPTTTAGSGSLATTLPGGSASTTVPIQVSGPRTVLSPIGLNIRSAPSKTGAVVGTAGQGATLTVLGHTDQGGGWYQVKGTTTTGYITDNPVLSAEGKFTAYSSTPLNFAALYPEHWTVTEAPTSVVFHPPSGSDSVAVSTAATVSQLGRSRSGYRQDSSETVVVCGVTGDLVTLVQGSSATATTAAAAPPPSTPPTSAGAGVAERYLILVRLKLDAQHALGVDANLADLAQLQTIKNIIYSISFPFPQCQQGASPGGADTSSTAPPTTIH
jgi:hypothetical protein